MYAGIYLYSSEAKIMSKFTLVVQMLIFTAIAFAAHASQGSEFDIALTGRVSMDGTIISSACDIDAGDGYQSITMPVESRGKIKRVGEGAPQHFSIKLTNCSPYSSVNPDAWKYINIIFDGNDDQGLFRVQGNASGVALEIRDSNGSVIRPGMVIPWQRNMVNENKLDYQIKLKNSMRDLVVGDYSAVIRYRIEYF